MCERLTIEITISYRYAKASATPSRTRPPRPSIRRRIFEKCIGAS